MGNVYHTMTSLQFSFKYLSKNIYFIANNIPGHSYAITILLRGIQEINTLNQLLKGENKMCFVRWNAINLH